jgi:hypothetical protein
MPGTEPDTDAIGWSLTTWEGLRREQLRRWAELSLRENVQAQEDMRELSERFAQSRNSEVPPVRKA